MKRGRGFVYSTSSSTNTQGLKGRGGEGGTSLSGQQLYSGRGGGGPYQSTYPSYDATRKRQRSPEASTLSSTSRATRGGYEARQGINDVENRSVKCNKLAIHVKGKGSSDIVANIIYDSTLWIHVVT